MEKQQVANIENDEALLELRHVCKNYVVDNKPFPAIKDLNLRLPRVGFVSILGASGSGKTTLLNVIGGLDHYTSGDMLVDGVSTKDFKSADWDNYRNHRIGFVFQSYNLISHLSILQNVELPLRLSGMKKAERLEKAKNVLIRVGLGEYLKKRPNQLSGGQMQRVAIARALVNDPQIILADEPTGALDSETSIQVMDLIKEIGKDRLVLLVTHNKEIADAYSDRIIFMKDGRIVEDDISAEINECAGPKKEGKKKRTSMSFSTALRSSMQNVVTKKGRSTLTALACSFGIVGVALVLATSNGFTGYVKAVEGNVASSIPISISPTSYGSIRDDTNAEKMYPNDNLVHVYSSASSSYVSHTNHFSTEYINYLDAIVNDSSCPAYGTAMSVLYNRVSLDFHFLTEDGNDMFSKADPIHVSQYDSAGSGGSTISSVTGIPSTIIHELYGGEEEMTTLYDIIDGRFPKQQDELVLIVDRYNRVDFNTMRKLGFYSQASNASILKEEGMANISFEDIVYSGEGDTRYKTYKAYTNSNFYGLTEDNYESSLHELTKESWKELTPSIDLMTKEIVLDGVESTSTIQAFSTPSNAEVYGNDAKHKPIDCKIVGVIRPRKDSYISLMPSSLAYTKELKDTMSADAETPVGKKMAALQKDNWYLPRFQDEHGDPTVNDGKFKLEALLNTAMKELSNVTDPAQATAIVSSFTNNLNGIYNFFMIDGFVPSSNPGGNGSFSYYYQPSGYLNQCKKFGTELDSYCISKLLASESIADAMIDLLMDPEFYTSEGAITVRELIAYYYSYSLITSILVFPNSLTTKDTLRSYLSSWNDGKADIDRILYNDVMNDVTGQLGNLISMITLILVVFASISLVVSSILTAIITYVSVLERTKEIGVIRACGGRKRDVGLLFESECVVIGFVAGVIGVAVAAVLCSPLNAIVQSQFPGYIVGDIAVVNYWHVLLLLLVSVSLSFLSGFIPATMASRKDPVVCLRSE